MTVVTSAEVQKNFGRYREQAVAEPVIVTQYGNLRSSSSPLRGMSG